VGPVEVTYDVDAGSTRLRQENFPAIEAEMQRLSPPMSPFERFTMPIEEAIGGKNQRSTYKLELLHDLKQTQLLMLSLG